MYEFVNEGTPLETRSAKGTPHQMRECLHLSLLPLVREGSLALSLRSLPSISTLFLWTCLKPPYAPCLYLPQNSCNPEYPNLLVFLSATLVSAYFVLTSLSNSPLAGLLQACRVLPCNCDF